MTGDPRPLQNSAPYAGLDSIILGNGDHMKISRTGYSSQHKGFRCLDLTNNKVYISRHVRFNETDFPFSHGQTTLNPHEVSEFVCVPVLPPAHASQCSHGPSLHQVPSEPIVTTSSSHGTPLSYPIPHAPATQEGVPPFIIEVASLPMQPYPLHYQRRVVVPMVEIPLSDAHTNSQDG
ncbi:hypothetical protein L3X38_022414 [Prunus dulcis]|uniref:Retroviral polymerase SH3-like domain-containing protein n=1 Tax=Prunus dulcis TaxID=3755 RepID=A0AAD4VVY2_PRUDU|nr:hypothetical protein L3X38_022414 [Prunus dulcis]